MTEPLIQWRSIETAPRNEFVLVRCPSGYTTTPYRILVAERVPNLERLPEHYWLDHPELAWRDHAGDAVTDSGFPPAEWMPLGSFLGEAPQTDDTTRKALEAARPFVEQAYLAAASSVFKHAAAYRKRVLDEVDAALALSQPGKRGA